MTHQTGGSASEEPGKVTVNKNRINGKKGGETVRDKYGLAYLRSIARKGGKVRPNKKTDAEE